MRWFRCRVDVYYGDTSSGGATEKNVIVGPYLYNNKLYGTETNPVYSVHFWSSILTQEYQITPVEGAVANYHYHRIVGLADNRDSKWGEEIPNVKISGKYQFYTNIAKASLWAGFSIPLNFYLFRADGTTFQGDCIRAITHNDRYPDKQYCGLNWGNVSSDEYIKWGVSNESETSATIPEQDQNCIIDFGEKEQDIPAFLLDWIEHNADKIEQDTEPLIITMTTPGGILLKVKGKICDRDIKVVPKLQSKTVTESGEVTADNGYVGLSEVIVTVNE